MIIETFSHFLRIWQARLRLFSSVKNKRDFDCLNNDNAFNVIPNITCKAFYVAFSLISGFDNAL